MCNSEELEQVISFLMYSHKTIRTKIDFFLKCGYISHIRILFLEHHRLGCCVQFLTDIWEGHSCCRHSSGCSYSSASLVHTVNVILLITAKFCPFWTNFSFPWTSANAETVYSSPQSLATVNILISICLFMKHSVWPASSFSWYFSNQWVQDWAFNLSASLAFKWTVPWRAVHMEFCLMYTVSMVGSRGIKSNVHVWLICVCRVNLTGLEEKEKKKWYVIISLAIIHRNQSVVKAICNYPGSKLWLLPL